MNQKEWKYLCNKRKELLDFMYYNNTRKIQRSLKHNSDPAAKIIHHLRDTEEQRKYNDEHYELWGHNLDGTFEYGKYVVFVTREQHIEIHRDSYETKQNKSAAMRGENNHFYGKRHSEETKKIIKQKSNAYWSLEESRVRVSETLKQYYKSNPVSDETRRKISNALKGHSCSEERIQHIKYSRAHSAKVTEHNKDMQICKEHYSLIKEHKFISWNNFQKLFKKDYYLLKAIIFLCNAATAKPI